MVHCRHNRVLSLRAVLLAIAIVPTCSYSQTLEWTRPLETNFASHDVSADGLGNIYVSGYTSAVSLDAFVAKYDALGTLQWSRTLATNSLDWSWGVSADGMGNAYVTGHTEGSLGGTSAGSYDAFVAKYDAAGNQQWSRQLGTGGVEQSQSVSADSQGNVFLSGYTRGNLDGTNAGDKDVFLAKYDAAGNRQWTRQFGTSSEDFGWRVSGDAKGNAYITGWTTGSLGGTNAGGDDVFVAKYDAVGNLQWTRQLGTSESDRGRGVSADGQGNVFVSGWVNGRSDGTIGISEDAFVAKYDSAGVLIWFQQLGIIGSDYGADLMADHDGNVYVLGYAASGLDGGSGGAGGFVRKYDGAGNLLWTVQSASVTGAIRSGVSTDGLGNIYFSGGSILGKVSRQVPEPSTAGLLLGGISLAVIRRCRSVIFAHSILV